MLIVFTLSFVSSFLGALWARSVTRDDFKTFLLSEILLNTLDILTVIAAIELGLESLPSYVIGGTLGGSLAFRATRRRRA